MTDLGTGFLFRNQEIIQQGDLHLHCSKNKRSDKPFNYLKVIHLLILM